MQIAVKFKIAPRKHPDPDSDPKGRNWHYWSQSTEFFLFGALAANPEIYYQDFFPTWNKITKKVKE
jgi:hypothetical protein